MPVINENKAETKEVTLTCPCLDAALTLDCGQAFRWAQQPDGGWHGVAYGRPLTVYQNGENVTFRGADEAVFEAIWRRYFDLDRDYSAVCERLKADEYMRAAVTEFPGIRILRQEPWEALCSFIISQNNNIPRIKGIIDRLCRLLGEPLGGEDYAFPTPEAVAAAGVEGLAPIRAGFRAKYIIDAAQKVSRGEIDFDRIAAEGLDYGREELIKIKGVGAKVAECTLLYGFGKVAAFPVDVWVRRIMQELYPNGLPECAEGVRGIAQQYLFHWRRSREG